MFNQIQDKINFLREYKSQFIDEKGILLKILAENLGQRYTARVEMAFYQKDDMSAKPKINTEEGNYLECIKFLNTS